MTYTTLADVKTFLGIATDEDDTLLSSLIPVAQAHIDAWCGRSFAADSDTTRHFAACHPQTIGRVLYLDQDLCAVSTIVNGDGETLNPADYLLYPADAPHNEIYLTITSGKVWTHNGDPAAAIAVTGRWAYATSAPPAIVHATNEIIGWLYRHPQHTAKQSTTHSDMLPPQATVLLQPYRRLI
jgi:uncharacterized phiE125 gp8 family phage protein